MELLQTPINGTGAFTFGMERKFVRAECIPPWKLTSRGIFMGDNPFKFIFPVFLMQVLLSCFFISVVNFILKPFGQTTIVGQIMSGIIAGPSFLGQIEAYRSALHIDVNTHIMETIAMLSLMLFLFLVGVRMDLGMVMRSGKESWIIGIALFLFPLAITLPFSFTLRAFVSVNEGLSASLPFIGVLQGMTSFHVIACLLEDLKLLNSELGRLAMSSSMISGLCCLITTMFSFTIKQTLKAGADAASCVKSLASTVVLIILVAYTVRPLMKWMIKRIPEGKPLPEGYLCIIFLFILVCSFASELCGQHVALVPIILGLAVPDGPPLGSTIVDKLECFVSNIMLPLFFATAGGRINLTIVNGETYMIVGIMAVIGFLSKFVATVLPSLYWKIPFQNAVTLGLILGTQGIVDLQLYARAIQLDYIDGPVFSVLALYLLLNTGITSPIVKALYDPSKRYVAYKKRTIQHTRRNSELRILVCIHNQENVPSMINVLEASNPTSDSPLAVYVMDLVELVGRASPLLIAHQNNKTTSGQPASRSDHTINAFRIYENNNEGIVSVQAFTCIAPYATMHNDICTLAVDKRTPLVILPFHKHWSMEGVVENSKHRTVNQHILEKAPCSVGILVDRGALRGTRSVLENLSFYNVAVIFVSGADDREALAYGMRMADHPNVNVTLVRFIESGDKCDFMADKKHDNDLINEFRLSSVGNERMEFREEFVEDGVGTVSVIRSLESSYDLILVGRGQNSTSVLLKGLTEWNEFSELGFLGDMLASTDIESKVSVLVMQQHTCAEAAAPESPRDNRPQIRLQEVHVIGDHDHDLDQEHDQDHHHDSTKAREYD